MQRNRRRARNRLAALLCVPLLLAASLSASGQVHDGDLTLSSQSDVDAFNYARVGGNLRIQGAGITNLSALRTLEAIEGDLQIVSNPVLTDLDGLSSLTSIRGDLIIYDNDALVRMDGLSSLSTISGTRFGVVDNAVLKAVENLPNLTNVESLTIVRNPKLRHVDGLESLNEIGDFLSILENDSLKNLEGLASLKKVGGRLEIWDNRSLNDCTCNLGHLLDGESIGGPTRISGNETGCNSASEIRSNPSCEIPKEKSEVAITELKPGKEVRLRTVKPGSTFQGRLHEVGFDTLVVNIAEDSLTAPEGYLGHQSLLVPARIDNIDSLWVRGRATSDGARIGVLTVGTAATLLSIAAAADVCSDSSSHSSCSVGAVVGYVGVGVLAGAVVGGLIGAGIGAMIPKGWRLKYSRGKATAEIGLAPALGIAGQIRVQL